MESIEIETCKLTFFYVQGSPEKSASQKLYNVSEKSFHLKEFRLIALCQIRNRLVECPYVYFGRTRHGWHVVISEIR